MSEYVNLSGTRLLGGFGRGVLLCKNTEAHRQRISTRKVVLQKNKKQL